MGYRWRGFEHPELYKMINSGPGAAASEPQTVYWQSLTEELTQVDSDLNKKLTGLNATWEGEAAERAQTGLTPLAEWAGDAESASGVMRASTELQADYVSDARNRMPEPVPVTTPSPSGWQVAAAGVAALTGNAGPAVNVAAQAADHELQEAAQSEAEQRAVETMQTYESSSTWNRDTLGTFVAPPDVVVASPPPQGGTLSFVESTGDRADGVNGSSQGTTTSGFSGPSGSNTSVTGPNGGGQQVPTGGGGGGGGGGGVGTVPPVGGGGGGVRPPQNTTPSGTPPPGQPPFGGPPGLPGNPPGTNPPFNGPGNPPFTGPGGNPPFNPNNPNLLPTNNLTGFPNGPGNAGEVARGAQPLRGGLPGGGFGPGGLGGPGAIDPDGSRASSQLGRGMPGVPGENGAVRTGPGGATAANAAGGGRGGTGGAMGAGGRRSEGEDDDEHYAADYLMETDDVFGHDDLRVAPTVIGESSPQQ